MHPPLKYQPYRGYGRKPWLGYHWPGYGRRVRTRGDWRWEQRPRNHSAHAWSLSPRADERPCRRCGRVHCRMCGCHQPWKRWDKDSAASVYEKRRAHRTFRRRAQRAIGTELACADPDDADVSHAFRYYGTWLD